MHMNIESCQGMKGLKFRIISLFQHILVLRFLKLSCQEQLQLLALAYLLYIIIPYGISEWYEMEKFRTEKNSVFRKNSETGIPICSITVLFLA